MEPYNFLTLRAIGSHELLHDAPPSMGLSQKEQIKDKDLLYKIFRGDTKLVRSLMESNSFNYTGSHDWNLLWSSSSCKSFLYEGLNEYQKINHFPQSYEITRKDRLCININKLKDRHGSSNFDFLPETYCIPDQFGEFV